LRCFCLRSGTLGAGQLIGLMAFEIGDCGVGSRFR
jgi:hypothetical protein